ncbi:MAG TPA: Gfo/Idh/MocA family oxidoreductase [Kiritimatiellia bacterium]|nr:Gfo/Idh/MocA family oxidoreductase [Kiritimatiellia bacterium]
MRVAIIGAGLQCKRRAPVVKECPGAALTVIDSLQLEHAQDMAKKFGCDASADWRKAVVRSDVDAVVVCTPPHVHAEISIAAMKAGKHVLCEKPLTRTVAEAEQMVAVAKETGRVLKCGFNHRHHPAIRDAKKIVDGGGIGKTLFGRCRYGICGRPGYEKEWRADPKQAAGGQFIEQGTHAIDLFRWFMGDVDEVTCMTGVEYFSKQALDDNGMAIFRMKSGGLASLHASLTQWKNQFSFEVFGEDGYVMVEGLGASYGVEQLIHGKRDFDGPFKNETTEYRGGDISWKDEWKEFVAAIDKKREPLGNAIDGLEAMRAALAAYEAERTGRVIKVRG